MEEKVVRCKHCNHVRELGRDYCPRCLSSESEELAPGYNVQCSYCMVRYPHEKVQCPTCGADEFEEREYNWCDRATLQRVKHGKCGWTVWGPVSPGRGAEQPPRLHIPPGLTQDQQDAFVTTYWPGLVEETEKWWKDPVANLRNRCDPQHGILKRLRARFTLGQHSAIR